MSTEKAPKVSVSILTYDQKDIVGEAIESALAQVADFPIEIRIGDDYSTDGTRDVIARYRDAHPDRIFLNLQPRRPTGIPGRLNNMTNLVSCRGEYIALLDGDDFWTDPHKLQGQVDRLDAEPGLGGAAHDAIVVDERGLKIADYRSLPRARARKVLQLADLFDIGTPPTSSFMFRRALIDDLPRWFEDIPATDVALYFFAMRGGGVYFEPATQMAYRRLSTSIMGHMRSHTIYKRNAWRLATANILADNAPELRHVRNFRAFHKHLQGIGHLEDKRYAAALLAAAQTFAIQPMRVPAYLGAAKRLGQARLRSRTDR
ncbi:MAG: glycosyltransferase [Pontixanthobacter sp.]